MPESESGALTSLAIPLKEKRIIHKKERFCLCRHGEREKGRECRQQSKITYPSDSILLTGLMCAFTGQTELAT